MSGRRHKVADLILLVARELLCSMLVCRRGVGRRTLTPRPWEVAAWYGDRGLVPFRQQA